MLSLKNEKNSSELYSNMSCLELKKCWQVCVSYPPHPGFFQICLTETESFQVKMIKINVIMQKYLVLYADSHNMIKFGKECTKMCSYVFKSNDKTVTFPYQTWTKERSHDKYKVIRFTILEYTNLWIKKQKNAFVASGRCLQRRLLLDICLPKVKPISCTRCPRTEMHYIRPFSTVLKNFLHFLLLF